MDMFRYGQLADHFFYSSLDHYFGRIVKRLPFFAKKIIFLGMTYYLYDGIYYKPYGGRYMVVRPPFGTTVAVSLVAEHYFRPVRISYYNTVPYSYNVINENYGFIAEQNEIIAKNNEIIAQQQEIIDNNNAIIAQQEEIIYGKSSQTKSLNQQDGNDAYYMAKNLGLVQSYADANVQYYYEDGIFYVQEGDEYKVIVPPAGARVELLPEDYELITLSDGMEYYMVDETVYMVTLQDGKAYFEVLGQLYE